MTATIRETHPYLARFLDLADRRYPNDGRPPLPALDVPPRYRKIFEDWANGRVDFVAR